MTVIWLIWQIDKEGLDKQVREKKEQEEAQEAQRKAFGEPHDVYSSFLFWNVCTDNF